MAVDMFMLIDGVQGETKDKVYASKNAIDVLAWSWGMSNSGTAHVGGGAGAGKVNVQDLSFTKYIDKASTTLALACCKGTHFKTATLIVRKAGGTPLEYITITMTEVMITGVSTGGSGGEDRLTENVILNFAKVKVEYKSQDEKGGGKKEPEMSWDIAANVSE
jgi:type VI secretion system secreted protein Hcp